MPGFAGYFLDEAGQPTVYLTHVSQRPAAEAALAGWLSSRGFSGASLQVREARYDWFQLHAWYGKAWASALSVSGAVYSDVDEGHNRLRFGGTDVGALTAAVAAAGIPSDAFVVERASPIVMQSTLQDGRVRPVPGGYQINFLNVGGRGHREPALHAGVQRDPRGSAVRRPAVLRHELALHDRKR